MVSAKDRQFIESKVVDILRCMVQGKPIDALLLEINAILVGIGSTYTVEDFLG